MQWVLITTEVVSSYPAHGKVCSIQHYVIQFISDLRQVGGFLRFPPLKKIDRHDITEILLKVALNIITLTTENCYRIEDIDNYGGIYLEGIQWDKWGPVLVTLWGPLLGAWRRKTRQAYTGSTTSGIASKQNAFKFKIAPHKQISIVKKNWQEGGALCLSTPKHNGKSDTEGIDHKDLWISWLSNLLTMSLPGITCFWYAHDQDNGKPNSF